jgi:hypothetical protein
VTYGFWHYFKRPVAATAGPAAELAAAPATPRRRYYWSRAFATSAGVYVLVLLVFVVVAGLFLSDSDSLISTVGGALFGLALVVAFCAAVVLYHHRKTSRR